MKGCELCGKSGGGMMYCEADSARLCSDCDSRVHGDNFLVAKHTRVLLCQACHSPTPWMASGPSLPPALSLCPACHVAKEDEEDVDTEEESRIGTGEEEEEEGYSWSGDEDEEGKGENQVVPWSPVRVPAAERPPVASSLSSEDDGGISACGELKRLRRFGDDDGGDSDLDCDSEGETSHLEGGPPLRKQPRTVLETQPQDRPDQTCGCQKWVEVNGRHHQETPKRDVHRRRNHVG